MHCPYCNSDQTYITDSRESRKTNSVLRTRVCKNCGKTFKTEESVKNKGWVYDEKENCKQLFDRQKLIASIVNTTYDRNISTREIVEFVDEIIVDSAGIKTKQSLIEAVGKFLSERDYVSYVRYMAKYITFVPACKDQGEQND